MSNTRTSLFDRSTIHPGDRMSLIVDDIETARDPLDMLLEVEQYLLESHGMTFMQAVRAGMKTLDN